jgi:hypothetical protein
MSHIRYWKKNDLQNKKKTIWKMEQRRKKVTQRTLFQACVQCTGAVDLKVGNEVKMTQNSTLFLAYANLSWYINCSLTCHLAKYHFLSFQSASNAWKAFDLIMNISITESCLCFRRGIATSWSLDDGCISSAVRNNCRVVAHWTVKREGSYSSIQ